jgi:hypothetical protein
MPVGEGLVGGLEGDDPRTPSRNSPLCHMNNPRFQPEIVQIDAITRENST